MGFLKSFLKRDALKILEHPTVAVLYIHIHRHVYTFYTGIM